MNDNLIKDKECENDIRKEIIEFSLTHEKDETSNPIPWEALKCVLRGLFIKHGSRLKKEKEQKKVQIMIEIENLEKKQTEPQLI